MSTQGTEIAEKEVTEELLAIVLKKAIGKDGGLKLFVSRVGTRFLDSPQSIPISGDVIKVTIKSNLLGFVIKDHDIQTSYSLTGPQKIEVFTKWLKETDAAQIAGKNDYENPSAAAGFARSV